MWLVDRSTMRWTTCMFIKWTVVSTFRGWIKKTNLIVTLCTETWNKCIFIKLFVCFFSLLPTSYFNFKQQKSSTAETKRETKIWISTMCTQKRPSQTTTTTDYENVASLSTQRKTSTLDEFIRYFVLTRSECMSKHVYIDNLSIFLLSHICTAMFFFCFS